MITAEKIGTSRAKVECGPPSVQRLYREKHDTFEAYCQERWDVDRRYAYRLIDAATVVENVAHGPQIAPTSERQARPLVPLSPPQQVQAWTKAVESAPNGKPTANQAAPPCRKLRVLAVPAAWRHH